MKSFESFGKLLNIFNCIVNLSLNHKESLSLLGPFDKRLFWVDRIFFVSVLVFNFFNFTRSFDLVLFVNVLVLGVVISLAIRFYLACKVIKNRSSFQKRNCRSAASDSDSK